jgi:hypothetical protein
MLDDFERQDDVQVPIQTPNLGIVNVEETRVRCSRFNVRPRPFDGSPVGVNSNDTFTARFQKQCTEPVSTAKV